MNTITNYLLFNQAYLEQLQGSDTVDEAASTIAQGVQEWYDFKDDSDQQAMLESWVMPLLSLLELASLPLDGIDPNALLLTSAYDEAPLALCYVAPPGANLDETMKGRHWMAQAVIAAQVERAGRAGAREGGWCERGGAACAALRWVILTNGDQWRLLDGQALRRYEAFLEVDIPALLQSNDPTPVRLFYRCFHRTAFERNAKGESGLERMVEESARASKQAEDHLKASVSHNEGIVGQLSQGLVQATGKSHFTEEERDAIYSDATHLLYRMLFLLYAESRGLLPLDNPAYRDVSMEHLVEMARAYLMEGMVDPEGTSLWTRLKRLSTAIYRSDETLGIPAYNGGLFNNADKPYLRDGFIADQYLARAIFDVAFLPVGDGYRRIAYEDLSVRHLGSLYEGMIEYKLFVAEEAMLARRDSKGNIHFLPRSETEQLRNDQLIPQGDVYFAQSSGERHATGTYYTPEMIVDYIVRQTVVRGLEERFGDFRPKLIRWLDEVAESPYGDEQARMQRTVDRDLVLWVEQEVLSFRVCDPAMGSGHFLVNAAHQITNFVVETLHRTPWADTEVDCDPIQWRRRVGEHCLFGVDINPMAVELAKLSLWLAMMAEGKPLSFLDHHLRQGNSLVGAKLEELADVLEDQSLGQASRREMRARDAGQLSMLDLPEFNQHIRHAVSLLSQISDRVADTVADVKAQERDYEQVREELEPYRKVANLVTARHFGVAVQDSTLAKIASQLVEDEAAPPEGQREEVRKSEEVAEEQSFFHWELEFPVVFFNESGPLPEEERGFDAVVGNPPWVNKGREAGHEYFVQYARRNFVTTEYQTDLYTLLMEQALELLIEQGIFGMIVPDPWLANYRTVKIRQLLLVENQPIEIIHTLRSAFPNVGAEHLIVLVRHTSEHLVSFLRGTLNEQGVVTISESYPLELLTPNDGYVILASSRAASVIDRIEQRSTQLGSLFETIRGVGPYHHRKQSADIIETRAYHAAFRKDDTFVPELRGSHLTRYNVSWDGTSWISYGDWLAEPREKRFFKGRRLLLREIIGDYFATSVLDEEIIVDRSVYIALQGKQILDLYYVLALLASRLLIYWYTRKFNEEGELFPKLRVAHFNLLPVRQIDFHTPNQERIQLFEETKSLYTHYLDQRESSLILDCVNRQLEQEPERADVIHDLLAYLAEQMIALHKQQQRLEEQSDLFRFVPSDTPALKLDKALGSGLTSDEALNNLDLVYHDIEGLRLVPEDDDQWRLELDLKLRDPDEEWKEHQRDDEGNFIRETWRAYRLPLDKEMGRFYHYAFERLGDFEKIGSFPSGYTRTTLAKLQATKIPRYQAVELAELDRVNEELREVRRRIELTDTLIDQIVYKLYGLTDEEIAIVEGRD